LLILPWAIVAGGGGVMAGAAVASQPHTTVVETPGTASAEPQGDFGPPVAANSPPYPPPCHVEQQWTERYGWTQATVCG
jgi:hypothetical protein